MKYFFDTEFLEGTQKGFFSDSKPTIDLISIGIVAEDGREYYAISRDFNLKEAWNRWQQRTGQGDRNNDQPREYWIRENVLFPVFVDLLKVYHEFLNKGISMGIPMSVKNVNEFNFKNLKWLLKRFGMSNDKIARQVFLFVNKPIIDKYDDHIAFDEEIIKDAYLYSNEENHEFYAYYSAYDWVGMCWLYGKMIDLPHRFPKYCNDLKQMLDGKLNTKKWYLKTDGILSTLNEKLSFIKSNRDYPVNPNDHNALSDAKWNKKLYNFINNDITW